MWIPKKNYNFAWTFKCYNYSSDHFFGCAE